MNKKSGFTENELVVLYMAMGVFQDNRGILCYHCPYEPKCNGYHCDRIKQKVDDYYHEYRK